MKTINIWVIFVSVIVFIIESASAGFGDYSYCGFGYGGMMNGYGGIFNSFLFSIVLILIIVLLIIILRRESNKR